MNTKAVQRGLMNYRDFLESLASPGRRPHETALEDGEIETLKTIDRAPRAIQAVELLSPPEQEV